MNIDIYVNVQVYVYRWIQDIGCCPLLFFVICLSVVCWLVLLVML